MTPVLLLRLMEVELVPDGLEVAREFEAFARLERTGPRRSEAREADAVLRLDAAGTPAHDHHAVGHADRLADIVGHEDDGLVLGREDAGDLVGDGQTRLEVDAYETRRGAQR